MKKIITILLIISSLNVAGQYKNQNKEAYKTIALFTTSIVLGGIGDALNDDGMKPYGHACDALSIGLLVASPFLLDIDKSNWASYILSYTFIRFALFDASYNLTRGLPVGYVGNSCLTDKALRATASPDSWIIGAKSISLVIGFSIPIKYY